MPAAFDSVAAHTSKEIVDILQNLGYGDIETVDTRGFWYFDDGTSVPAAVDFFFDRQENPFYEQMIQQPGWSPDEMTRLRRAVEAECEAAAAANGGQCKWPVEATTVGATLGWEPLPDWVSGLLPTLKMPSF